MKKAEDDDRPVLFTESSNSGPDEELELFGVDVAIRPDAWLGQIYELIAVVALLVAADEPEDRPSASLEGVERQIHGDVNEIGLER